MATNAQVQALVDNYKSAKADANKARLDHLEKKAKVRTLRSTIETLVEYGVVNESVFADEENDAADETASE